MRIGLHSAVATRRGSDYSGKDVHVAARIAALARGGEILASSETAAMAGSQPTTEPRVVSLKGVSGDVEVVSVAWNEAGSPEAIAAMITSVHAVKPTARA